MRVVLFRRCFSHSMKLKVSKAAVLMFRFLPGGYLAHSLAIMTDAAHLLTDFGSMMVSLFSLWISSRPPTKTMNFGWHRSGQDESSENPEWMDGGGGGVNGWMDGW